MSVQIALPTCLMIKFSGVSQRAVHLDSSTSTLSNSVWHSSTRRVNHGHQTNEAELLRGEVHLLSVEGEALWKLVIGQVEVAET